MEPREKLLNFIYKNAKMGTTTLEDLIDITNDAQFRDVLIEQKNDYDAFVKEVMKIFKKHNNEPKDISKMAEIQSYIMLKAGTLTDKSPSNISEMLMQGSGMGIIKIIKNTKESGCTDKDVVTLAANLLKIEETNFNKLKEYL